MKSAQEHGGIGVEMSWMAEVSSLCFFVFFGGEGVIAQSFAPKLTFG